MKYLSLLLLLLLFNHGYGQKNYFTFGQFIAQKEGSIRMPFAMKNSTKNKFYLRQNSIKLKHQTKNYIYCNADADFIYEAAQNRSLEEVYFQISSPKILSDSAIVHHKADIVHSGLGGLDTSYTGKGVIIGVVDQGIDFNHPDFKTVDGRTRVLRYWDHTVDDISHPNFYDYYEKGILWDSAAINNGTCTSLETSSAHGSTVTGMAASNGLANGTNKGFAPESDLIIVETDFNQTVNNWKLTIADACDYIFKVADSLGKPAVINLSLGDYYGTHDATDPAAELIETLLDEKEGRIVVCAAGNSGSQGPYHVGADVGEDTSFVWSIPNSNPTIVNDVSNVIIYDFVVDTAQAGFNYSLSAHHINSNYANSGSTTFAPFGADFDPGVPEFQNINNENGELIAVAFIYREFFAGKIIGQIAITGQGFSPIDSVGYVFGFQTFGSGHFDLWGGSFSGRSDFVSQLPDIAVVPEIIYYNMPDTLQTIVDSWNCSEKVISVGNLRNRMSHIDLNGNIYNASPGIAVGELFSGSSKGPSRNGVQKPDITASGDISLGSGPFSWLNNPAYAGSIDEGGFHIRNGGTSMASPQVAGIAALYLQKCPSANYTDFKNDLLSNADIDNFTGTVPNYGYGFGKANALNTILARHENVTINAPEGICPGEVATLDFTSEVTPIAIEWNTGSNNTSISTASPGDYQVVLQGGLGCKFRSNMHSLMSFTNPIVNAGNDVLLCPNSLFTLTAEGTADIYNWNNDVIQSESFTVSAGEYIVTGLNLSGCSAVDTMYIELLSTLPVSYVELVTEIGVNQTAFNVTAGNPENGTYSGPGIIGTSFHPALAGVGTHAIAYTIIDGNGCVNSDTSYINVYEDASIFDFDDFNFSFAPNPAIDFIEVVINNPIEFQILDIRGSIVYENQLLETGFLNLKTLQPGSYIIRAKLFNSNIWQSRRFNKIN